MMRHLVLVTQPEEARPLSAVLTAHNPDLAVRVATGLEELTAAVADAPPGTRLVTALTGVVVPPAVLDRLTLPGYNLHPGPPSHPGRYPAAFALYDGVRAFGATAHELAAAVDSGPIVAVETAPVPEGAGIGWFHDHAYRLFMRLFLRLAPHLATSSDTLPHLPTAWGKPACSRKRLEALCRIPPGIAPGELARRHRAFGHMDLFRQDPS